MFLEGVNLDLPGMTFLQFCYELVSAIIIEAICLLCNFIMWVQPENDIRWVSENAR